jgi:hypothetical protein
MRQLFIDSRDRVSGTSSNFRIQLPETLVLPPGRRGRIDNLRVPQVFPTIQASVNDTLVVNNGSAHTVTIAKGNFHGAGLAAAIQAALTQQAGGTWSCTYDIANIAMTLTCLSSNFTITGGTFAARLMAHPYTQTANQYVFSYVSVLGLDVLYLSSSKFATLDTVGPHGAHDPLMCGIVDQDYGSVMTFRMPQSVLFDIPAITTGDLDFQLRDRSYKILSIVPNISFTLSID